jgi:peptidoglycan/xylan/chitin deacetylase (PgdA/CDA1 family)
MSSSLTTITYHYVRPIASSPYPGIKGLELELFRRQLDFLMERYSFVSMERLIAFREGRDDIPHSSALLTFDDGYRDHFLHVFPELASRGLAGAFYVPVDAVEGKVLDVNKIHFVLASGVDVEEMGARIDRIVEAHRDDPRVRAVAWYRETYRRPSRWDSGEVVYAKRMLQTALPEDIRSGIVDAFFRERVTEDECTFSADLYASKDELRTMRDHGMHIGGHGVKHVRLSTLDPKGQHAEIAGSKAWLIENRLASEDAFSFCYPYGDYDAATVEVLRECGAKVGLSLKSGTCDPAVVDSLEIPRLDTNVFLSFQATPSTIGGS